jgi:outer membrane protein OmpA-like peptidoglycan-associated protein
VTVHGSAKRANRGWWFAALLAVPTVLAGFALVWPGREGTTGGTGTSGGSPTGAIPTAPAAAPERDDGPAAPDHALLRSQVAQAVAEQPIVFPPDSAELAEPAARTVQRVADLLVAAPEVPVLVEGHVADTPGGLEAGAQLAERRAVVVSEALVAAGVAAERITTRGRGAEQPLATPEQSRRVEISIG